jgi:hypothetical protein
VAHCSRRDAGEDALLVQQAAHLLHRLLVRDEHLPVELRYVENRRHVALLERTQPHDGIAGEWFRRRNDDVRKALT